ncbi:MAG TPA: LCP family protein [Anaerolineales bacterium]
MSHENWVDPQSQPNAYYPPPMPPSYSSPPKWMKAKKRRVGCGCGSFFGGLLLALVIILTIYLFAPLRTNLLLLGIDYAPPGSSVSRSDTIILATVIPTEPYIGVLSIPRDLWVNIPGIGENRVNTAHFFAEAQQVGSGPKAAIDTIQQNFGVDVDYFVRIRFDGVRSVVDAMGGVDIDLDRPMAGYPAGRHHLTGNKALAFARHRLGADDFFRMEQGQLLIKAIFRQLLHPSMWPRLPSVVVAIMNEVDTNIPLWQWPRLALAFLRAGPDGLDNRTLERDMTTPFTTNQGASVLLPDWSKINPLIEDMFGY